MSTGTKPPSTKPVEFKTVDGKIHRGFFLRDANKYVRGVNRWKDTERDAWFDDDVVVAWGFVPEQIDRQLDLFEGGEHIVRIRHDSRCELGDDISGLVSRKG